MTIRELSKEEISEMSMLEIAHGLMKEARKPFAYMDLLKQVSEAKGMSEEEMSNRISYLYTDLNIDGRFVVLGDNKWGLKSWYPLEQIEEELVQAQKAAPRKKKKSAVEDDELVDELDEDYEDFEDEFEDLEDELDEISNEENEEDITEIDGFDDDSSEDDEDDDYEDEDEK